MANDDFDIAALAAYLHLLPAQVSRLVDRGKLPGRRVAGEWRFSRPEIHHWLEESIGLSDDDQLVKMEKNLERVDPSQEGTLSMAALIPVEAIQVPLAARTRGSVVTAMTELAASTGLLWDPVKMAEAVNAREAMQTTAFDIGVALLHPRRPQPSILCDSVVALGIVGSGIPFGARTMTDLFFLICVTEDHQHLRILARLSRMISDEQWLASLRLATDSIEAHELIIQRSEKLDDAGTK